MTAMFISSYEKESYEKEQWPSELMAGAIRLNIQKQTEMVHFVEESFGNFQSLAQITKESVSEMETLRAEMQELGHAMVVAADRIQDVSQNTADVTQNLANSMQEQVPEIQRVAQQVYALSIESEQIKQRLNGQTV